MDITSLYTVIPNEEGLLAIKYLFLLYSPTDAAPQFLEKHTPFINETKKWQRNIFLGGWSSEQKL